MSILKFLLLFVSVAVSLAGLRTAIGAMVLHKRFK